MLSSLAAGGGPAPACGRLTLRAVRIGARNSGGCTCVRCDPKEQPRVTAQRGNNGDLIYYPRKKHGFYCVKIYCSVVEIKSGHYCSFLFFSFFHSDGTIMFGRFVLECSSGAIRAASSEQFTILQSRYKTSLLSLSTSCFSCGPFNAASTVPRRRKHALFRHLAVKLLENATKSASPSPPLLSPPRQPGLKRCLPGCSPYPSLPPALRSCVLQPHRGCARQTQLHAVPTTQNIVARRHDASRLCLKRSPSLPLLGRCPASSLPR